MRRTAFVLCLAASVGCASDGKGEEEETPVDIGEGKLDSQRSPTDHGSLVFGAPAVSALTDDERFHAWTFELSGDANVELTTSYAVRGQRRTDTVLYLYRESATGWGSYIARNDDYGSTTYSQLVRSLGAGRYRALVKGHQASTRGKFSLAAACDGAGCVTRDPNACLFGDVYHDIAENPDLTIHSTSKLTLETLPSLGAADRDRFIRAVELTTEQDVETPEQGLALLDQEESNVIRFSEPAGRRSFVAFEFGLGDNSYGAIFEAVSSALVTKIHDGDLEQCTVQREVCLLPDDFAALKTSPAFTQTSARVVTAASQLTGVELDQALGAFRRSYDVATVAEGLARVDDGKLNVIAFRHTATGADVVAFEYGAGDTSVGAIYYPGTTQLAAIINDLFIDGCTLFE